MLRLIEYKGLVDDYNRPVGHGKKALYETIKLCEKCGVKYEIYAPFEYSSLKEEASKRPNAINVKNYSIKNARSIMKNLLFIKTITNRNDVLWFTNIDWYCYLFIGLFKIKNSIIVTTYQSPEEMLRNMKSKKSIIWSIIAKVVLKGQKKVDLFIETYDKQNRKDNELFIPDYLYSTEYEKYHCLKKKPRVVCAGVMNEQKELYELVSIFSKINYPLLLCGYFHDQNVYEHLMKIKTPNVTIENRLLEYEELYTLIAESEFSISPTRISRYSTVTSGLARESVYLKTKVIAPQVILDNMGVDGIGYCNISDLIQMFKEGIVFQKKCTNDLSNCSEQHVVKNLYHHLKRLL